MSSHDADSYANGDDTGSGSLDVVPPPRTPTPDDHIKQDDDWFMPGRFFSIWAPEDQEIHKKKFVLLGSQNKEGKGVLVETLDKHGLRRLQQSSSAYRTHVELRKSRPPDTQSTITNQPVGPARTTYAEAAQPKRKGSETQLIPEMKFKFAYMDEHARREVPPNTYILLEHTYNIPFFKYKCEDHGMLDDNSLEDLRQHYVERLIHSWRLAPRFKKLYANSTAGR